MLERVDLPRHWHTPLMALSLVIVSCLWFFHATWASMEAIWDRSETFTHGYLVAPISLWLIWQHRQHYLGLRPRFSGWGALAIVGCGLLWLVADLVQVLVIRQWAAVGMLIAGIWSILGTRVSLAMLFPLLFLFLMVPFGEEFIPWLMDYTASFVRWQQCRP